MTVTKEINISHIIEEALQKFIGRGVVLFETKYTQEENGDIVRLDNWVLEEISFWNGKAYCTIKTQTPAGDDVMIYRPASDIKELL